MTEEGVRLSIAVMSVPQRAAHVESMIDRLTDQIADAQEKGIDVTGVSVYVDEAREGPWASWRGAWRLHEQYDDRTHHVILQDDILFGADLPHTLAALARSRPDDVVSGFLPRKSVEQASAEGLHWVRTRRFLWAQCVFMPVSLGDELLRWADRHEAEFGAEWKNHDDVRIAAFLRARGEPVYVTVPNIVEHIGDELGSVMGHHGPAGRRRARVWVGRDSFGANYNWEDLRYVRE